MYLLQIERQTRSLLLRLLNVVLFLPAKTRQLLYHRPGVVGRNALHGDHTIQRADLLLGCRDSMAQIRISVGVPKITRPRVYVGPLKSRNRAGRTAGKHAELMCLNSERWLAVCVKSSAAVPAPGPRKFPTHDYRGETRLITYPECPMILSK